MSIDLCRHFLICRPVSLLKRQLFSNFDWKGVTFGDRFNIKLLSDATDNEIQYVFIDEFCGNEAEISADTLEIFGNGLTSKGWFSVISR